MGYQIKLELLTKPKSQLAPAERKAIEMAARDWAEFLYNSVYHNTKKITGNTASSIRKIFFGKKGSAKVYYDLNIAPHAAELMRGNKTPRIIAARGDALKFTWQGRTVFASKVMRKRTFGQRVPERLRNNEQVLQRLTQILSAHFMLAATGESQTVDVSPVTLS